MLVFAFTTITLTVVAAQDQSAKTTATERPVRVGCKNFTESAVLGEMIRALAIAEDCPTPPIKRLAGTKLVYEGLKAGTIDIYVEYTGTLRQEILRDDSLKTLKQLAEAVAAATTRQATGPIGRGEADENLLLNLSLQNAATARGVAMTSLLGGLPIVVDGQTIGAVGVGGGTGEQDQEVARAGIAALVKAIEQQASAVKK